MTDAEIRLQCMEMALGIARAAGKTADRDFLAETQSWLYTRIVSSPAAVEPPKVGLLGEPGKPRLDKSR